MAERERGFRVVQRSARVAGVRGSGSSGSANYMTSFNADGLFKFVLLDRFGKLLIGSKSLDLPAMTDLSQIHLFS